MFEIKKLVAALFMNYDVSIDHEISDVNLHLQVDLVEPREKINRYSWIIMPESVQTIISHYIRKNIRESKVEA
jgi:hypothetical protein